MSKTEKLNEEQVFKQELDDEEMETVSGGRHTPEFERCGDVAVLAYETYGDIDNCYQVWERQIYGGEGFPNCAATVEESSFCGSNDACYTDAVSYQGRTDCFKAWQ